MMITSVIPETEVAPPVPSYTSAVPLNVTDVGSVPCTVNSIVELFQPDTYCVRSWELPTPAVKLIVGTTNPDVAGADV